MENGAAYFAGRLEYCARQRVFGRSFSSGLGRLVAEADLRSMEGVERGLDTLIYLDIK